MGLVFFGCLVFYLNMFEAAVPPPPPEAWNCGVEKQKKQKPKGHPTGSTGWLRLIYVGDANMIKNQY